jgi:hypothetical protein
MKILLPIGLCCLLAGGAMAQRRGGGGGGAARGGGGGAISHSSVVSGGSGHIGSYGGAGRVGGVVSGGGYGGYLGSNTFRGYGGYGGYRIGSYPFNYGYRGSYGYGGAFWPYGLNFGYYSYPYYGDYGYSPYISSYGYGYDYPAYQPNVTMVYPEQQSAPLPVYVPNPAIRRYDEYGQAVAPPDSAAFDDSSPLYLIAFKDHVILPAVSYSVTGTTLEYVNLDHATKQVPLDTVDRDLSRKLNRERRVAFNLPGQ